LKATATSLGSLAGEVSFDRDFDEFVKGYDLHFIDISPPPFDRFKFTSRYAVPDIVNLERFTMPYLPIGVAKVLADFDGGSGDELKVKEGQLVYVMQPAKEVWVFVMQKPYGVCGFVPGSFLSIIGVGVAVLLREGDPDGNFDPRVGSVVAVIGDAGNGAVVVEDYRLRRCELPRDALAIL
jgi:hypothetical protein